MSDRICVVAPLRNYFEAKGQSDALKGRLEYELRRDRRNNLVISSYCWLQ